MSASSGSRGAELTGKATALRNETRRAQRNTDTQSVHILINMTIFPLKLEGSGKCDLCSGLETQAQPASVVFSTHFKAALTNMSKQHAWAAQPVKRPTLDFGSGHNPVV